MEIGQQVRVRRLRDRLPAKMIAQIKENPVGTIEQYKMVDGSGVGVLVRFDKNFATWFFEDELEAV